MNHHISKILPDEKKEKKEQYDKCSTTKKNKNIDKKKVLQKKSRKPFGDISNENRASGKRLENVDGNHDSLKVKSRLTKSPVPLKGILLNRDEYFPVNRTLFNDSDEDIKKPVLKSILRNAKVACPVDWNLVIPFESIPDEEKEEDVNVPIESLPKYTALLSGKRIRLV